MSQQNCKQAYYWLALRNVPRLANDLKIKLVKQYGLRQLFQLSLPSLVQMGLTAKQIDSIANPAHDKIQRCLEFCSQQDIDLVSIENPQYPSLLLHTSNPPILLFTKGNTTLLNAYQLAIVGSRSATISALEQTKRFAAQLSQHNVVITSGLALGVDAAAHRGALSAMGKTIAVVATGLDIVYPARHKPLAQQILDNDGLILSEYPPGSKPHQGCFPKRNRIITGISVGTLVMEATLKSGSLISARLALEQNRDVFAMPGAINNPQAKGCHSLLKQGAILVDELADILTVLEIPPLSGLINKVTKKIEKTSQQDLFIDPLLSSVDYETTSADRVASRSQLPIEEVITRLITLELKGLVAAVPGGYIRLN